MTTTSPIERPSRRHLWEWLFYGDSDLLAACMRESGLIETVPGMTARHALAWCVLHAGLVQSPVELPGIGNMTDLDALAQRSFGWLDEPVADA